MTNDPRLQYHFLNTQWGSLEERLESNIGAQVQAKVHLIGTSLKNATSVPGISLARLARESFPNIKNDAQMFLSYLAYGLSDSDPQARAQELYSGINSKDVSSIFSLHDVINKCVATSLLTPYLYAPSESPLGRLPDSDYTDPNMY